MLVKAPFLHRHCPSRRDGMLVEMKDFFKKNFIPFEHPSRREAGAPKYGGVSCLRSKNLPEG
jgi:hypothetical protein